MQISVPESKQGYQDTAPLEKGGKRLHEFVAKFSHDWMMFSAAGLAYNLMIAVVPFGIALLAVLGFTLGNLNPQAQTRVIQQISHAFPSAISSQNVLQPAITRLNQSAGLLTIVAVALAILGGSRLFIALARCFDIVYRTESRRLLPQYVTALLMMLVFIILTPIMALASFLPAVMLSLLQSSALSQLPGVVQFAHNSLILSLASLLSSILVAWILFLTIYMAVPNQRISFKHSWLGAVVAALLLVLFLVLFPFYITHFMQSYTGITGFAIIFLLFFYYFAMILLFGAQINAYFAEGVRPLPDTLATVLRKAVGHNQAEPAEPGQLAQTTTSPVQGAQVSAQILVVQPVRSTTQGKRKRKLTNLFGLSRKSAQKKALQPVSKKRTHSKGSIVQAIAGTALAFTATVIRLRRSKRRATRSLRER